MKRRILGVVMILCACLSVIMMFFVQASLKNALEHVHTDSPSVMNTLLQSETNADSFADAARDLQTKMANGNNPSSLETSRRALRQRFDVIWSANSAFRKQFPANRAPEHLVENFFKTKENFLAVNEPLMEPDYLLTDDDLQHLLRESALIKNSIHQLNTGYFVQITQQTDDVDRKIKELSNYMTLFTVLLVLTGGLGAFILVRTNLQTKQLFDEAQEARSKLAISLDEMRSGKREQKAKDSFIASASHDLRQPLHALGLFLNSLKHQVKPEGERALQEAMHCTADLNRLFNSMLDLSRLDAGVVKVENEIFNIGDVLANLQSELRVKANINDIEISVRGDSAFVISDPILVIRIIRNLADNAIVHSGATKVYLGFDCIPCGCKITIRDNGCGIPIHEHEAIFSEHYQLKNPERDRSKGMGLGLAIVKRLSDLLNHPIELKSNVNEGTEFRILLPECTVGAYDALLSIPSPKKRTYEHLSNMVVVVIEDDAGIQQAMKLMLAQKSIVPISAETGDEALGKLAELQLSPDLIIADYRLRDHLTGDAVINELRDATETHIPALIITGDTSPSRLNSLKDSNFDILHKPVEAEALYAKIDEILERDAAEI